VPTIYNMCGGSSVG